MISQSQVPQLANQIDATLLRLPLIMAQLAASIVRVPLLAAQLATSLLSVPFLAAQLLTNLLGHIAERLDEYVNESVGATSRQSRHTLEVQQAQRLEEVTARRSRATADEGRWEAFANRSEQNGTKTAA